MIAKLVILAAALIVACTGAAHAQEYVFEKMWPELPQPWYFNGPTDVAVDESGHVYVADTYNDRIQKFTSSGQFLTAWGGDGDGDGQFSRPGGVAVDTSGNVYVVDTGNHRIQKFTSLGDFLTAWGSEGSGNGQFDNPRGVAVDTSGNVYVADTRNHRIQKFTSSGQFLTRRRRAVRPAVRCGGGHIGCRLRCRLG
jgi:DNA-binding beta-propeller fold protein YncE